MILKAFIDKNDKFPIWDGSVLVYNSTNNKNKNLKGKIPVQVKGTTVKNFSGSTRKYPIRVNDLENYLKDGGAIFFVVEIINPKNARIYYESLIPLEIDDLLSKKKENQKEISTEFKLLDELSPIYIENICHEFLFHRGRQFSTIKYRIPIEEMESLEKLSFTIFAPKEHLHKHIFENDLILYGQRKNESLELPISKIKTKSIVHSMSLNISINSKKYFENYMLKKSEEENIIILGENIKVNLERGKLNYKIKGNFNTRFKEIQFIKDLLKTKHFYIGKYKIDGLTLTNGEEGIIDDYYEYLIEIKNLLNFFNIKEDLEMDSLSEQDYFRLKILIDVVLYNKKIKSKSLETGIMHFKIANINILVVVLVDEDKIINIYDYFDIIERTKCNIVSDDGEVIGEGCICTELKSTDIIKTNNLNLQKLKKSIKKIPLIEEYAYRVNFLVLELIKSFDIKNEMTDCLYTAINLCEWLEECSNHSAIYKMNKLQIIKRIRELNKKEKEELIKMRGNFKEDISMLCGISILLENEADFEYFFEKMDQEKQEEFRSFPIYKLSKEL